MRCHTRQTFGMFRLVHEPNETSVTRWCHRSCVRNAHTRARSRRYATCAMHASMLANLAVPFFLVRERGYKLLQGSAADANAACPSLPLTRSLARARLPRQKCGMTNATPPLDSVEVWCAHPDAHNLLENTRSAAPSRRFSLSPASSPSLLLRSLA